MATNPIEAGFTPTDSENLPWLNEIGELLDHYQHALKNIGDSSDDPLTALLKHSMAKAFQDDLVRHGVTLCGGFGHA